MRIPEQKHGKLQTTEYTDLKFIFIFNFDFSDGLNLRGMYSYSDGFFRRTVHYAADEGGYRVTK